MSTRGFLTHAIPPQSLVRKSGDVTPLIHAMRIEHTDMAIILLGTFSRYINNLQDEDFEKQETKKLLKMLSTYTPAYASNTADG